MAVGTTSMSQQIGLVALVTIAAAFTVAYCGVLQPLANDDECLVGMKGEGKEEECVVNALQQRALKVTELAQLNATLQTHASGKCAALDAPENRGCAKAVRFAIAPVSEGVNSARNDPKAEEWFRDMSDYVGVDWHQASKEDLQRLYWCAPPEGMSCGLPPCSCSKTPCDTCYPYGAPQKKMRPGCTEGSTNMACKPPALPFNYNGMAWPKMVFPGTGEMHIFAIGDWGGMDGSLKPIQGRKPLVAYDWGDRPGPSVFPRTRWDRKHTWEMCSHDQFVACFNTHGQSNCSASCGFVPDVDQKPQQLVAASFAKRAAIKDPQYILNVGDNFYWGGLEQNCGTTPMDQISFTTHHQFEQIFENVYRGPGLDGKPWLGVLGNHDWGGRQFTNGWDQQIAYTWFSPRWVLPAAYWSQRMEYPDNNFTVDIFFIDTNFIDAEDPGRDPNHNICSQKFNPQGADCSAVGGPKSVQDCKQFFEHLWEKEQQWLEKKLSKSDTDWQIVLTHFPCGHASTFYRKLHRKYGLDLLVTGHRHDQELWEPDDHKNHMGNLTCFVTGGGGGITSEATPNPANKKEWYGEGQYGFFDLTISKSAIVIESVNYDGEIWKTYTLHPVGPTKDPPCGNINATQNKGCHDKVVWAANFTSDPLLVNDPNFRNWFWKMEPIAGIKYMNATLEDYQRFYYCGMLENDVPCDVPPCTCTRPPCDECIMKWN